MEKRKVVGARGAYYPQQKKDIGYGDPPGRHLGGARAFAFTAKRDCAFCAIPCGLGRKKTQRNGGPASTSAPRIFAGGGVSFSGAKMLFAIQWWERAGGFKGGCFGGSRSAPGTIAQQNHSMVSGPGAAGAKAAARRLGKKNGALLQRAAHNVGQNPLGFLYGEKRAEFSLLSGDGAAGGDRFGGGS